MAKAPKTEIIINATLPETRIALLEDKEIQELHVERDSERGIVGNIYKGKVIRVLPGMQAAFVDIGHEKAAFLYVDDVFFPDMKVPLTTNSLPEPTVPVIKEALIAPRQGGRGRHPKVVTSKVAPSPGSPEAHALLQQEYGRQMLDIEKELETQSTGILDIPKPTVDIPKSVVEEETTEQIEQAAIYRPEPLVDPQAWEETLAIPPLETSSEEHVEPRGAETSETATDDVIPTRRPLMPHMNIADVVKEGQEILVQVAKDPIGTKGARLTCQVSLPGRYLVFMPTVDHIGVSRRIESETERRRLKDLLSRLRPAGTGVIIRTASAKQTDKKLKADLDFLVHTWNEIQKKFNKQHAGSLVYQDLTIVLRAIRDMFTDEVNKVIVDSKREHKAIMKFVLRFMPHMKDRVELYTDEMPIFDYYGIETELERALERKVWLKSGGYIMIDQAEALVAIDVNTGRYVGKKNLEETILKTNLEAVEEIAYQLRLRNCGGIIILDLIDMEKDSNKEKVYKALEDALRKDRARPTIMKISQIGLIEMTRKRTRDTIVRSLCEPCFYCTGRGFVKNKTTIAYGIMRDIEREGVQKNIQAISIQCHPTVADVLLGDKRDVIEDLEHHFGKKISIRANGAYHVEQYELVAHQDDGKNIVFSSDERKQKLRSQIQERMKAMAQEASQAETSEASVGEESETSSDQGQRKPSGRRPHHRGGRYRQNPRQHRLGRRQVAESHQELPPQDEQTNAIVEASTMSSEDSSPEPGNEAFPSNESLQQQPRQYPRGHHRHHRHHHHRQNNPHHRSRHASYRRPVDNPRKIELQPKADPVSPVKPIEPVSSTTSSSSDENNGTT